MVRSWTKIGDFVQEVANARIYDGVHYRNSTEVGTAMGKQIGDLEQRSTYGRSSRTGKRGTLALESKTCVRRG
jgi:hypothetical protein